MNDHVCEKFSNKTRSLVVVSDFHCGCQLGLIMPEGVQLEGGGHYEPNIVQKTMWQWWLEFWDKFVPFVTRGESYDVLVNGDTIDGEHHGTTSLIANNKAIQRKIARPILERIKSKCRNLYIVKGTGVHDGEAAQDIEDLAKEVGAIPDKVTGQYSRWELWYRLDGEQPNVIVHALHHIGGGGSTHYETSAPTAEIVSEYVEAAQMAELPPVFVIRSHRHRFTATSLPCKNGTAWSIVTPAWQGKTAFAHKIAGARVSQPQFGGVVLRNGDEEVYFRRFWRKLSRPEIENGGQENGING